MPSIADRVRFYRKRAGLTQEALGAAMMPPRLQQYIYKYETERLRLSAEDLGQIATILQVPITAFYDGELDASLETTTP